MAPMIQDMMSGCASIEDTLELRVSFRPLPDPLLCAALPAALQAGHNLAQHLPSSSMKTAIQVKQSDS
jgi:hypothetical protein